MLVDVNLQSKSFKVFLRQFLGEEKLWDLLCFIEKQTKIYVFSGFIRNFLLGEFEFRDLDIVVENIDKLSLPRNYISKLNLSVNSYGGYKVVFDDFSIDVWGLENTWMIRKKGLKCNPFTLIKTPFFNFSAIVYDFNKERFISSPEFDDFFKTRSVNVVNAENPNVALCIVNTIYYSISYNLGIQYGLCRWVSKNYRKELDFEGVQLHHFGRTIYNRVDIRLFYEKCCEFVSSHSSKTSEVLYVYHKELSIGISGCPIDLYL